MIKIVKECDPNYIGPKLITIKTIVNVVFNCNKIEDGKITIIFGEDELLAGLKKQFFQENHFTDVIAFRLNDYDQNSVEGEIYISLPRAKENAKIFNESYKKEVARLIVHGCLHLIGYSDKSKKERSKMTEMENNFLDKIDWISLF